MTRVTEVPETVPTRQLMSEIDRNLLGRESCIDVNEAAGDVEIDDERHIERGYN